MSRINRLIMLANKNLFQACDAMKLHRETVPTVCVRTELLQTPNELFLIMEFCFNYLIIYYYYYYNYYYNLKFIEQKNKNGGEHGTQPVDM